MPAPLVGSVLPRADSKFADARGLCGTHPRSVQGYCVAAYAGPAEPGSGYVGYAKVCRSRPVSYWEADCLLKDGIGLGMRTPEEAMAATMELARRQIALLPPVEELPAVYRHRPIQSHERSEFGLWGA
jgi:hypothetical protein